MTRYEFDVYGTPKPQGSKRHVGNGVMIESAGESLRTWREDVKHAALAIRGELDETLTGPLFIDVTFRLPRPRSHYRTGKNAHLLRDAAPDFPWRKPDLDKLVRSTFDAITSAGLWIDDAAAVMCNATKVYARREEPAGARIRVETLGDDQ